MSAPNEFRIKYGGIASSNRCANNSVRTRAALLGLLIFSFALTAATAAPDFFSKDSVTESEQKWYGKTLLAMLEPVLTPNPTSKDFFAVRILCLDHWESARCIRYWNDGTNLLRRSVMLSGEDTGAIQKQSQTAVGKKDVDDVFTELDKMKFWSMAPKDDVMGDDAGYLILEVVQGSEHKVVVRWSPDCKSKERGLESMVTLEFNQFVLSGLFKKTTVDQKPSEFE